MGSCVSVHKDPESVMKLRLSIGSKNDEKLLIPSPVKEKADTVNVGDRKVTGSKDEAFFDSQPWLESDCEDDFFSVNGEFTPSRGSTPVHHFTLRKLLVNNADEEGTTGSVPEPSPPDKKKRLSELFKESLRNEEYVDEDTAADEKNDAPAKVAAKASSVVQQLPKSTNGTPSFSRANSVGSSERTPNGVLKAEEKSLKSSQCCLPKLLSSRSFSERKKKMSPAQNVG